ncbi:MAG TPA: periplasmic heavy metal sensor [Vicinamibacteria bacterium]|nr:periplasmic heavy metal sensor [Vicinamibacteria bacterium]
MNSRSIVPTLGILVLSSSVLTFADQDQTAGPHGGSGGPPRGFRALHLSQDQESQMHALWQEGKSAQAPKKKELAQARQELRTEVFSDVPDESKILGLKEKVAGLESDLLGARVDLERRLAAVLTPDQRQTMRSLAGREWGHHSHHRSKTDQE